MKKNVAWSLAIIAIVVVAFIVLLIGGAALLLFSFEQKPTVRQGTVVEMEIGGSLGELPSSNPLSEIWQNKKTSLWDLRHVFQYAARDERVRGILMEIEPLDLSWGQVEELRQQMHTFRKSGKPLDAFVAADMIREIELYLASAADSVTVNPDAGLLVNGLVAEVSFYKRALERLRIKPQFIQFKEYKSPDVYQREKMTAPVRTMYRSLLEDIMGRFTRTVSRERKVEPEVIEGLMEEGVAPVERGVELHLIDTVGYLSDVRARLLEGKDSSEYKGMSASRYLKGRANHFHKTSRHKVAVVGGIGLITAGRSDPFNQVMGGSTMASNLRKLRHDKKIQGVILRVDSPGGSAVGSDMVWKEVRLLEKAGKPVVVSMSGVAGSGGYYISMGARHIVSQPSTITGSIGVIFGKFDIQGLYQWLGVSIDRVKTAPSADILSFLSSLSPEQKKRVHFWMERVYDTFVRKASQGRGLKVEDLEPRAHGRVYTGAQALKIGLVDELGGVDQAVSEMRKALEIPEGEDLELVLYPKPKTLWESILSGDFFALRQNPVGPGEFLERLRFLSQPGPWLLMPEVHIY